MTNNKTKIPCPCTNENGEACTEHIVEIVAITQRQTWTQSTNGGWDLEEGETRKLYRLFCSAGEWWGDRKKIEACLSGLNMPPSVT